MIRAVLVEDQILVRASLSSILVSQEVRIVGETDKGSEALELLERHRPNLLILDLALPDIDGVKLLRSLRLQGQNLPVLVVTGASTAFRLRSSFEAGANGFLSKNASPEELMQAVRIVAGGGRYVPAGRISPRQQQILEGVVDGLTNDQIAAQLHVSRGTVKVEINSLFQTLGCADRTHLACEAAIQGLVTTTREKYPLFKDAV